MNHHLDGTVALVTGASSGIGAETARQLAEQGAAVALAARRGDRLRVLAAEIAGVGGTALSLETDVTRPAEARAVVDRTVECLGRLDIVINNAGIALLGPVNGAPLEEWDRMVALNVQGLLHVAHASVPHLIRAVTSSGRGVADLINIGSVGGRVASAGAAVYNLTKFGVGAFSEALRQELAGEGVRVGLVQPGAVDTELPGHIRPEIRAMAEERFGVPEALMATDVAEAIVFAIMRPRRVAINEVLIRPSAQA